MQEKNTQGGAMDAGSQPALSQPNPPVLEKYIEDTQVPLYAA